MNQTARILVAVADRARAAVLTAQLEGAGFVTLVAEGPELLRAAREEGPDLVLLGLSGQAEDIEQLRVLQASRGDEEFLPVVCLCSDGGREARLAALGAGADEALAEPCDGEELAARIAGLLRQRRRQAGLAERVEELTRLSVTDPLTGLYNRRLFEERLREEFVRSQRFGDPLGLIMVDLDHFKRVNDRYGHLLGDEVLRGAAEVLRSCVREIDLVTRFGGEEFAVILPRTALPGVLTVAERAWRALGKARYSRVGEGLGVTASLGVACHPSKDVRGPAELVDAADRALYRAKRGGRDRIGLPPNTLCPASELRIPPLWPQADLRANH